MRAWLGVMVVVLLHAASGCVNVATVAYRPMMAAPAEQTATVRLLTLDEREPKQGGTDPRSVGNLRGGYGNPFPVRQLGPQAVKRLVAEATTDALSHAYVRVAETGDRILFARLKRFWIDGYLKYRATVEVEYSLEDSRHIIFWSNLVRGEATGSQLWDPVIGKQASKFATHLLERSLEAAAQAAYDQFRTIGFATASGTVASSAPQ